LSDNRFIDDIDDDLNFHMDGEKYPLAQFFAHPYCDDKPVSASECVFVCLRCAKDSLISVMFEKGDAVVMCRSCRDVSYCADYLEIADTKMRMKMMTMGEE
tara:strand:+ start:3774 stop:4076 length:303 start_codon:yes stop_codon:yes gene_type:complete